MRTVTETATDLYWESTGAGPAILLIPGTPGYGGQFAAVTQELASDHLVVTYDRRGTARSGAPAGWATTTVGEQADDAAAVLEAVGVSTATVFGTSNGAIVALELALRHEARVRRAVLHEMPLMSVLHDPASVATAIGGVVGPAMEAGGPRGALEAFLRFAYGDDVVDDWSTELRQHMLADAAMIFAVELPAFQAFQPDRDLLARTHVPVTVLVGEDQRVPFFGEAAEWVARSTGTDVRSAPGAHGLHFTAPSSLADVLRQIEGSAP